MPPNLPDTRTAQRLLDVLTDLEHALRNTRRAGGAVTAEMETRLANLQFENQRLRSTRAQAAERLGALLDRLHQQAQQPQASAQVVQMNETLQDDAA